MSIITISPNPKELITGFLSGKTYSRIALLTDSNTVTFCLPLIVNALPGIEPIVIPAGEEYKNLQSCQLVWEHLTSQQLDRHSLLIVLGGGVLGDLGGFCAATYKRGVDFVLMPTTLLAQVDASVGGKLGIDFLNYKNHIGVFCEPAATLISPAFLKTLPERELRSGFAEVIKHCLISDKAMWDSVRSKPFNSQDWNFLIQHSVNFKSEVVKNDPKERGLRKVLNFGHTVGHAVESYFLNSNNRIFHGEAIAIGMIAEAFIAWRKNLITEAELIQITEYLKKTYSNVVLPANRSGILELISQDKKNRGNRILMALTEGIGRAKWDVEVSFDEIVASLDYYQSSYT